MTSVNFGKQVCYFYFLISALSEFQGYDKRNSRTRIGPTIRLQPSGQIESAQTGGAKKQRAD